MSTVKNKGKQFWRSKSFWYAIAVILSPVFKKLTGIDLDVNPEGVQDPETVVKVVRFISDYSLQIAGSGFVAVRAITKEAIENPIESLTALWKKLKGEPLEIKDAE